MKMRPSLLKPLLTALVLLFCVGSVQAGRLLLPKMQPVKVEAKYLHRSHGSPRAPLWIIEYLDFQCSSCRDAVKVMDEYIAKYPKDIYLQQRYYPLLKSHLYALKSAIYSECAARQKKFWGFTEQIFEWQSRWNRSEDPDAVFLEAAKKRGLDVQALGACVQDPAVKAEVLAEREEALGLGLRMTPTFFMNGEKIESLPAMRAALDDYFRKKYPRRHKA